MRSIATTLATLAISALSAPAAFAQHDGGQGLYGEASDLIHTYANFIIIATIPLFCLVASIAYQVLEKRRLGRLKATKARAARADQRGGW